MQARLISTRISITATKMLIEKDRVCYLNTFYFSFFLWKILAFKICIKNKFKTINRLSFCFVVVAANSISKSAS